jgi:hypothetical protein
MYQYRQQQENEEKMEYGSLTGSTSSLSPVKEEPSQY